LVGFYGGAGVAAAPWVGWFPLAPGEAYRPGFAASARFTQRVNIGIAAAPAAGAGSYRYAQTSFAATAMSRESFGTAPAASAARVPLTPAQLSGASVLATHGAPTPAPALALAPTAPRTSGAEARLPGAVPQGAESPDTRRGQTSLARSGERRAGVERAAQARQANKALNAEAGRAPKPRAQVAERRKRAHPTRP
jgi:hypothetical protein